MEDKLKIDTATNDSLNIFFNDKEEDEKLKKIKDAIKNAAEQMNPEFPVVICFVDKESNYRFISTDNNKANIHELLNITQFSLLEQYKKR
tara:strand:- start:127 stop:396 length:270 start_codon:yes stop_codon:yes gene_type:complete